MIEEDLERSEERSGQAQSKLAEASQAADEAKRSVIYEISSLIALVATDP